MTRAKDAIVVDDGNDDDDDDDDDDDVLAASTPRATTFGERANARVRAFDDFTAAFVATESLDVSGGPRDGARGNAAARWSDEAFARAIRCELREPDASDGFRRAPRGEHLARLATTATSARRRATKREAAIAREAVSILRLCDVVAPATALSASNAGGANGSSAKKKRRREVVDLSEADAPTVVTTRETWTPLEHAIRGEEASASALRSPGAVRGRAERDWKFFNQLLDASTTTSDSTRSRGGDASKTRGRRGAVVSDSDDDDSEAKAARAYRDEDLESDDEDETNEEYARVGARLLFLHSCAVFVRDAYARVFAAECHGALGGEARKRAGELAQNALLYRLVVDVAPTEGDRSAWFAKMVDASCLGSERAALVAPSDAGGDGNEAPSQGKMKRCSVSRASLAPSTSAGAEDCGMNEVSSAARDVLEALSSLLDACESSDGASRRHVKIRVQLEDAYAEAWKCTGKARLELDEAKRAFMREIRHPKNRLTRAREILARRVDRRHAPGIIEGGMGGGGGRGAVDVFNYVAEDAVRAIKAQQHSDGSGDYRSAAAALGVIVGATAYGALALDPSASTFKHSFARCVDAFDVETTRSGVIDRDASASLALALAFSSEESVV
jgi:hypothetical protein